jgi:hypothetical protein
MTGKKGIRKIYLDVCTLCRPYDDQTQVRIRLETDAVFLILEAVRRQQYEMMVSPVHRQEVQVAEDPQERADIVELLNAFGRRAVLADKAAARVRAETFCRKRLGAGDAAHLVFAEASADCLISCDDRFVKRGRKVLPDYLILGPVEFCEREGLR